ncbi:hypothetical protein EPA93_06505 [Ktedonosporobacter rubrisoli]|uniref:Uncharacterized protein n=1 Tax=Ktedonosporobacter rubrisoli TaxID=2509675 RepID=A0A4P6JKT2_KTERU|nr:hypothetical protein [Ktedonosporobacter rubrisoli]QBD75673.1 hypothetical protein EPA93_06505 [Ktedonosporobacter rubrisoli]
MPMSQEAMDGLRAAIEYNPGAARYFMHALRFLPEGVRYKEQDRYGPLALMISAIPPALQITSSVSIPAKKPAPFPQEKLKYCEAFNREWLQRRFTKQELADIIEQILSEIKLSPVLKQIDASTTLILTAEGTFLSNNLYERNLKQKIDPEQQP